MGNERDKGVVVYRSNEEKNYAARVQAVDGDGVYRDYEAGGSTPQEAQQALNDLIKDVNKTGTPAPQKQD